MSTCHRETPKQHEPQGHECEIQKFKVRTKRRTET